MNKRGFTLLELMLVVVLISVMIVLAVPSTRDVLTGDKLKKTSRQLIGLERKLRTEAVRDQLDYIICIDLSDSSYWVISSDMTPEKKDEIKKRRQHLPSDVVIKDIVDEMDKKKSAGEANIVFKKSNVCTPAIIHLSYEDDNMTIIINPFLGVTEILDKYVDTPIKASGQFTSL